jgi:hypothetical protein
LLGFACVGPGPAQAPQKGHGRGNLDAGVDAEADQCNRAGDQPGGDRHHRFHDVPRDSEVLEAQRAAMQPFALDERQASGLHQAARRPARRP